MKVLTKENYYDHNALSNSSLNWLLPETGGSLKKYLYKSNFEQKAEESDAMRLGTLIHLFFEKQDISVFQKCSVPSPSIKAVCDKVVEIGEASESNILKAVNELDYQRAWKDETRVKKILDEGFGYMSSVQEAKKQGKELVTEDEYDKLLEISQNILLTFGNNLENLKKEGDELLNEFAITFNWPGTNIECKSLIDLIFINHNEKKIRIYDIKTTSVPLSQYFGYEIEQLDSSGNIEKVKVEGQAYKRNVHRQLAFYKTACLQNWPDYTVESAYIIGVETQAPYEISSELVDGKMIDLLGLARINLGVSILRNNYYMHYDRKTFRRILDEITPKC